MSITVKTTPVTYETVYIGSGQYQIPTPVVQELSRLMNLYEVARIDADEARAERREKNKVIVDRIIMNLINGEPYGRSVLKYSIDKIDRVENGEPVFEFRHEVEKRIIYALENKDMEEHNNGVIWKTIE